MAGSIFAFDDLISLSERRCDRALFDDDRLERAIRSLGIDDRRLRRVLDIDLGVEQALALRVSNQQERLSHMKDVVLGQTRLIVVDQRNDVAPGNVAEIDDGEAGGVEGEADVGQASARDGGADRRAVQHAGKRQIVDVLGRAGDLGVRIFAPDVGANRACHIANVHQ
jgi:hypothetical protein